MIADLVPRTVAAFKIRQDLDEGAPFPEEELREAVENRCRDFFTGCVGTAYLRTAQRRTVPDSSREPV
jgi:hypothetical protein